MNTECISSKRLAAVIGDPFYPPEDRKDCLRALHARLIDGKKVF